MNQTVLLLMACLALSAQTTAQTAPQTTAQTTAQATSPENMPHMHLVQHVAPAPVTRPVSCSPKADTAERLVSSTYTYDSEGRVTMHVKTNKRTNFDSTATYGYIYDKVEASAVDDISADLVARLKVKGRTFSLSGADLSLYDPSGRLVMHGRGSLTAPCAGLYLLKSEGKTVKVVVK